MGKNLKVTVCIVTYNQEQYIADCLNSVLAQAVDFDYEIIVADDCSNDRTCEIIDELCDQSRVRVKKIFHNTNIGALANRKSAHDAARAQYIAHLDGDDYWLPGKLQKQVDFLDNNQEIVQVWHRVLVFNDAGNGYIGMPIIKNPKTGRGRVLTFEDLVSDYALVGQQSSHMYRRDMRGDSYDSDPDKYIDYFYALDIAEQGPSYIMDAVYSAYRVSPNSKTFSQVGKGGLANHMVANTVIHFYERHNTLKPLFFNHVLVRALFGLLKGRDVSSLRPVLKKLICVINPLVFIKTVKRHYDARVATKLK